MNVFNCENEKRLYEIIAAIEGTHQQGIGIHESDAIECTFMEDSYGYRVYHKDGYCFDITWERQYDEEGKEIQPYYTYIEGVFDGFKELSLSDAIEIFERYLPPKE